MSLTSVRILRPHLTPENHEAVLARASGRSRREIEALIAELAPRPDVPSSVRKLPAAAPAPTSMPPATSPPTPVELGTLRSPQPAPPIGSPPPPMPTRRPSATACSSPSARRATTSYAAFRRFSAARSRTAIRAQSSTAPSPCSSRRSRRRSLGRRQSRGHVRSAPGRIGRFEHPSSRRGIHRGTSGARSSDATAANVPSSPETDTGAPSARSWSSTTSCPTRWEVWPPSRTSRFAVGATTSTKRIWSSALEVLQSSARHTHFRKLRAVRARDRLSNDSVAGRGLWDGLASTRSISRPRERAIDTRGVSGCRPPRTGTAE